MYFDWDENKNQLNKKKHGISFEEASTVFYDDEAYCYRQDETMIRIISARKATATESRQYHDMA